MSNNLNKRTYDEENDNKQNDYSSDGSNQSDKEKIKAPKKKFKKFSSNKSSKVNKKKSSKKESSDEESETEDDNYNSSNSEMDQDNETEDDNWESENKQKNKNKKESRKQGKHEKKSKKLSIVIAKRPAKKNDSDEESFKENTSDVEDGEVSDTDNNSDNNGNTSSSSSIFNDGYDNDLIGDDEDRKNLDSMTEKEREMEIYRRTEQRDLLLRQFEMKKKLKQKGRDEAMKNEKAKKKLDKKKKKSNKKSNDESDSYKKDNDDSNDEKNNGSPGSPTSTMMDRRKANESKRKDTHVSKALANLKADREKKKQQAERMEKIEQQQSNSQKKRNDDIYSSSSSSSSFSGAEDDSDNKRSKNKKRNDKNSSDSSSESSDSDSGTDPKSKQQINSKDDLTQIKLSRFRISKWCHAPFFKKLATGCFVRIGIGMNQGNSIYRVAEITDVVETAKVYELEATKTNKGFKLRHGEEERTYRLAFVSNQPFTDLEFLRWKEAMNKEGNPLPTKGEVEAKAKEIQSYNNYRYNDDDFDFIIKEKKRFNKGNENIAVKKMELLTEREASEQRNDIERMNEIDNLLSDLNDKATDLNTKRSGNFINFADINRRNREISNAKAEEAMKQEFERLKEQKDDPFQRRKGFPTLVATAFKKNLTQEQKTAETQKVDEEKEKKEKVDPLKKNNSTIFEDLLAPNIPDLKKNEANKQNEKLNQINPNDLFHAHNFEININLSEPGHASASLPPAVNGNILNSNSSQLSRRGLNLDEYKKKKGLF